jgi:hypothetical protein
MREEMRGINPTWEAIHNARIRFANLTEYELRAFVIIAGAASAINLARDAISRLNENTPIDWAGAAATTVVTLFSRRLMGLIPSPKILERRMRLVPTPYTASQEKQDEEWVSAQIKQLQQLNPTLNGSDAEIELKDIHRAVATFARHNLGRVREFPRIKRPLCPPYNSQYCAPTGEIIIREEDMDTMTLMEEFIHAQGVFSEPRANMAMIVASLDYGTPALAYNALLRWRDLIARYRTKNIIPVDHEATETHPAAFNRLSHPLSRRGGAVRGTLAYLARRTPEDLYKEYTLGPLELLHAWRQQYRPGLEVLCSSTPAII